MVRTHLQSRSLHILHISKLEMAAMIYCDFAWRVFVGIVGFKGLHGTEGIGRCSPRRCHPFCCRLENDVIRVIREQYALILTMVPSVSLSATIRLPLKP